MAIRAPTAYHLGKRRWSPLSACHAVLHRIRADTGPNDFYLIRGIEGTEKNIGRSLNSIKVSFDDNGGGFEPGDEGDEGGHKRVVGGNEEGFE